MILWGWRTTLTRFFFDSRTIYSLFFNFSIIAPNQPNCAWFFLWSIFWPQNRKIYIDFWPKIRKKNSFFDPKIEEKNQFLTQNRKKTIFDPKSKKYIHFLAKNRFFAPEIEIVATSTSPRLNFWGKVCIYGTWGLRQGPIPDACAAKKQ